MDAPTPRLRSGQVQEGISTPLGGSSIVHYTADSDAMITKGLISLLVRVLNDRKPEEILNTPITFIDQIGLREHLSPNRANGLSAMLDQMKRYALAFSSQGTSAP